MNDKFFKERARQVREIADRADPFTKKRLLELASRYDRGVVKRLTPLPIVTVKDEESKEDDAG